MGTQQLRSVGVVGAGSAGLTIAWYLQRAGVAVEVVDGVGVGGGSSRGNAGWLTPPLATPLPEPEILRYGLKALLDRRSPLHVSPRLTPRTLSFLLRFARNSTDARWREAMTRLSPVNTVAYDAFDELEAAGVSTGVGAVDILAVGESNAELSHLRHALELAGEFGADVELESIDGDAARSLEPQLGSRVGAGLRILGQRAFDPGRFCEALAADLVASGAEISSGVSIVDVQESPTGVRLREVNGRVRTFDAVVVATGAWLGGLVRRFGVSVPVQSGRGYSFTLADRPTIGGPVYLPSQRVVCTPLAEGTRIAGTMEIGSPGAPFRDARVEQIARSVDPYLAQGVGPRTHEWCGSRPCTADGLPLVGATRSARVFVHGGHGMWGMTQGPATAKLLADRMLKGTGSPLLAAFEPTR